MTAVGPRPVVEDLAEALYQLNADRPRRTTRAPSRWTDDMWREHARLEAERILAVWPATPTFTRADFDALPTEDPWTRRR